MAVLLTAPASTGTSGYTLLIADDASQVAAAQRLRHRVFATELGAHLPGAADGRDVDEFDDFCDHLIVRDDASGDVVGTYRMMPPKAAARAGRRYADGEFDLSRLSPLRDQLVEAGRSCVHPDHRSGAVVNLMWAGIARYLLLNNLRWLGGCASVPLDDGGETAAGVWARVSARHLSPPALRVTPRIPWLSSTTPVGDPKSPVPPLLRGYLRLGSWICGEPAFDADFGCADFYVLLSMDRIDARYLRHFLGGALMIWQPVSGCSDACRVGGEDHVHGLVAAGRMVRCAGVLLLGLILLPVLRGAAAATVSRGILKTLGVRLVWRGPRPGPGTLLVSNHVSWLDVVALLSVAPVKLVAKCEVRGWPGIGHLAAVLGAIFLDRSRPKTLPETVSAVTAELRAGHSVAVFPEGTTFCGPGRGRFRPALFQAAVDAGAPVVPVSISYDSTAAAFVGDDSLWGSVRRVAALRTLTVTLVGSPALRPAEGANRKVLARAAQASIGVGTTGLGLAA